MEADLQLWKEIWIEKWIWDSLAWVVIEAMGMDVLTSGASAERRVWIEKE